jgi:hypothetical protein
LKLWMKMKMKRRKLSICMWKRECRKNKKRSVCKKNRKKLICMWKRVCTKNKMCLKNRKKSNYMWMKRVCRKNKMMLVCKMNRKKLICMWKKEHKKRMRLRLWRTHKKNVYNCYKNCWNWNYIDCNS